MLQTTPHLYPEYFFSAALYKSPQILQRCHLVDCFPTGKNRDSEETVLSDHFTGSARKRKLPDREKQLACLASKGKEKNNLYMQRSATFRFLMS